MFKMKTARKKTKGIWSGVSPWLIIGTVIIIIPLFVFVTLDNVRKLETATRDLLLTQGETLIRSFEAGIRTGAGMNWGAFQLQKLLIEMSRQPDLDHIIVVSQEGLILADSDPAMVGESYGLDIDPAAVSQMAKPGWRIVSRPERGETFEVFRRFSPLDEEYPHKELPPRGVGKSDRTLPGQNLAIFVGMNMGPVKAAREKELAHTIMMAIILFAIGIFGVLSLFLAQAYRSARVSLTAVKVLSESIIRHMPIGLLAIDEAGNLLSSNQEAERILQLPLSEFLQKKLLPDLPPALISLWEDMKAESGRTMSELAISQTEETIYLDVVVAALQDDDVLSGRLMLLRDITELRQLREEVARSQRLAALGNLAAGLAHEIRNPLSSIKGFATYFRERLKDTPEDSRSADIMVGEVDRLNRVITQLLELSRPAQPEAQRLEMVSLANEVIEIVTHRAQESGVKMIADIALAELAVQGDGDQLRQVLLNLFLNAIEAMETGGTVTVRLDRPPSGGARIVVADTGSGITAENLPHIFDPYFTTKPAGTGLGLAIVHKIIEAHGGDIHVASKPGEGTEVTITLPPQGKQQ